MHHIRTPLAQHAPSISQQASTPPHAPTIRMGAAARLSARACESDLYCISSHDSSRKLQPHTHTHRERRSTAPLYSAAHRARLDSAFVYSRATHRAQRSSPPISKVRTPLWTLRSFAMSSSARPWQRHSLYAALVFVGERTMPPSRHLIHSLSSPEKPSFVETVTPAPTTVSLA